MQNRIHFYLMRLLYKAQAPYEGACTICNSNDMKLKHFAQKSFPDLSY